MNLFIVSIILWSSFILNVVLSQNETNVTSGPFTTTSLYSSTFYTTTTQIPSESPSRYPSPSPTIFFYNGTFHPTKSPSFSPTMEPTTSYPTYQTDIEISEGFICKVSLYGGDITVKKVKKREDLWIILGYESLNIEDSDYNEVYINK